MSPVRHNVAIPVLLFLAVFLAYVCSPIITSFDSRWSVHTSLSLVREGNADLNEFRDIIEANHYYGIEDVGGKLYTKFPIGVSVLAVPFVAVADWVFEPLMGAAPSLEALLKKVLADNGKPVDDLRLVDLYQPVELVIASFICALTAVCIFAIARLYLPLAPALLVVFIFAFCTSSWSTSSRALWQHGPSMLMLSIALYLLLLEGRVRGVIRYMSIPLALAFIIRPTNAIPVAILSAYVIVNHRSQLVAYLLMAMPLAVGFFVFNLAVFGGLLPPYFSPERVFHPSEFAEALAGNLLSPARGLLVYSPVLLLGLVWLVGNRRSLTPQSPQAYLLAIVVCHWLVIASFPHWWGGHSFGPRFFADMVPIMMYFVVLFFADLLAAAPHKRRIACLWITPLLLLSLYINAKGGTVRAVHYWNTSPTNIDKDPDRLWDWSDPPFLR